MRALNERRSYSIQRFVLLQKIRDQRLMTQRLPGDAAAQLARAVALARPVDLLVQPTLQPPEMADAEIGIKVAQIGAGLLHELGRVEIAQCVSREVAETAH